MIAAILDWSLRHRALVMALWGLGIVAGTVAVIDLPVDAFPDTTPVQVQINVRAPALSPLEIERQITAPVEQAISGLRGLDDVRSVSKFGFSQVVATFDDGTDLYLARQVVMERLQAVALPSGIERPSLGPVATGLGEVFHYLVTGRGHSLSELRTTQDWILAPQLRSVRGVAEVNSWGGDERQIAVRIDPRRLQRYDLSLGELIAALERNNANVGGGVLERAGEATLVQGIGLTTTPDEVARLVVASREGVAIRVQDVARVEEGRQLRRGVVTADGRGEAVLGLGFALTGENSRDVTTALAARLGDARRSVPPGVRVDVVYDRTELVDHVLETMRTNLLEGALLVIAILFAFLGNFRAGLVVASAIPLSMIFAGNLMMRFGIAGSLMSLGAIDFGMVVDSSVIQVENVVRRLAEDSSDRGRLEIVRDAVLEVRRPTMFGELIIAVVYLPILALEGIEGKLFRPMALTVLFALAGALLLSLTLIPVLATWALPRRPQHADVFFVRWLKRVYRPVVRVALSAPWAVIGAAVALLAGTAVVGATLGSEFVPKLSEGAIVINTIRLAGVSADESARYGTRIERVLLAEFPNEIARVWTRTGTAEVSTDPMGVELSDVFVTLAPRDRWRRARTQEELVFEMKKELEVFPGMRMVFTQPIEMRANEMISGVRSDLGVEVFGEDYDVIRAKAREIDAVLRTIPGAADVVTEQLTGQPLLSVVIDHDAIGRHGIEARDVLDAVEAVGSREVGTMQEGERRFPIAVRLEDEYRRDPEMLGRILVSSSTGDRLPLSKLVRMDLGESPSTINRKWGRRRLVVQANVRGRDLGGFVAEARRTIKSRVAMPPGTYVRYGGQFEHLETARARLLLVVPLALGLIFLLLYFTYGRLLDAARVFSGVPFAAVGGVLGLWARGLPFSISAAVGFIALFGVAVLNGMVLVSTIRQLGDAGTPLREAIERAAETRLRPVLMTALVAAVGFLPMALNTGIGAEVQRPLATVVIGGVFSSTLLTLVVLPALYWVVGRRREAGRA